MFTKDALKDIFSRFNDLNVLIIGDVMIDSYIFGHVKRLSPEAPVPIVNVSKRENRLGGAANVAKNIAALGAVPILCAVVGEDEKGTLFNQLLEKQNMSTEGIVKSDKRLTTVKFRIIGNNNHLLRVDEESESSVSESEEQNLINRIINIIHTRPIDVIIFEDYDKGCITPLIIKNVVEEAKRKDIPVVVDPKKKNFSEYSGVTLFKPNFKEFCEGLKLDIISGDIDTLEEHICAFQREHNIEKVLVSLSEHGVLISEYNEEQHSFTSIPAHHRSIADVSGAGDTLISVAALCVALKLDARTTAALSNLAGGVVCEYVGVVPIDKQKLWDESLKLYVTQ